MENPPIQHSYSRATYQSALQSANLYGSDTGTLTGKEHSNNAPVDPELNSGTKPTKHTNIPLISTD